MKRFLIFITLLTITSSKVYSDDLIDQSSSEEVLLGQNILLPNGEDLEKSDHEIEIQVSIYGNSENQGD